LLVLGCQGNAAEVSIPAQIATAGQLIATTATLSAEGAQISGLQFDLEWDAGLNVLIVVGRGLPNSGKLLYSVQLAPRSTRVLITGLDLGTLPDSELLRLFIVTGSEVGSYQIRMTNLVGAMPDGNPTEVRASATTIRVDPGPFGVTLLPESAGISNPVALALDPQKRLWVGTLDGRVYYREGKGFVEAPMPDPLPGDMVSFLVPDGRNTVWIGCVASGLYRWHAGRIDKLPAEAGLPMREPRVLQIDTKGNFWFGTLLGLFRISRAELEAVLDGRQSTVQAVTFGPKNGMPAAARFHYGFLPSSIRTPDGHLWFGTTFGGMEILPEDMISNAAPPSVLIEAVLARDKSVPFPLPGSAPLVFPPRPSPIQIRYTLPELGALAQVRFRYRLLGLGDDAWSSSDPQRIATFSNLPPGNYTFEVAATNPCALSPPKTASLSFTVRTAWWETLWFRFICALAGAFAVALLVNIIVRRRTQARILRLEQENALDRERARIARDMHDDLGASLTQIMLMSEAAATEHSLPDLDDIAEASRTISTTLDEIVWATNPRNDTLERLISYIAEFSEEYLELTEIQLRLKLPAEIPDHPVPAEKRHHVLLVVKEGLNNIVKYSSATHVQIRATLEQGLLRVVIADNGKGFDSATVLSTSNGLLNMRHRMEAIGGKAEIESEPDHGTTITLSVKV